MTFLLSVDLITLVTHTYHQARIRFAWDNGGVRTVKVHRGGIPAGSPIGMHGKLPPQVSTMNIYTGIYFTPWHTSLQIDFVINEVTYLNIFLLGEFWYKQLDLEFGKLRLRLSEPFLVITELTSSSPMVVHTTPPLEVGDVILTVSLVVFVWLQQPPIDVD